MPAGTEPGGALLSKSKFLAGLQCHKLLWWSEHEGDAAELIPDAVALATMNEGTHVGTVARNYVAGAGVEYERTFTSQGVTVRCDILRHGAGGTELFEVKSATKMKDEYLPDVAVQLWVLRATGLDVRRALVMHLNRECRFPDLSNLFTTVDVTAEVEALLPGVPAAIEAQRTMLRGPIPDVAVGLHCEKPRECAFTARCWPRLPDHHVTTLYRIQRRTVEKHLADGRITLHQLDASMTTVLPAQRQIRAVHTNARVVERGLGDALRALVEPVAHLDFETVAPAVPVWNRCRPYENVPAQFSVHMVRDRRATPYAWVASDAGDPRPALAVALVEACSGAATVVAYYSSFEEQCLDLLAEAVPEHAAALLGIKSKIVDLLPIVRDHVYDPAFGGSFSLKAVLPALIPELGYADLEIQEGMLASVELRRLMFTAMGPAERAELRDGLLAYCERDTIAMVRLVEVLGELAA
jgi:hypothetical protein